MGLDHRKQVFQRYAGLHVVAGTADQTLATGPQRAEALAHLSAQEDGARPEALLRVPIRVPLEGDAFEMIGRIAATATGRRG